MSTAVADVPPAAYGFPGSATKSVAGGGKPEEVVLVGKRRSEGFFIEEEEEEEEEEGEEVLTESSSVGAPSPASSSIGENSSSEAGEEEGGDDEEVQSKLKEEVGLGCLDSLEESLPIKRGLSNFYAGKSKSFTSLAEATASTAAGVAKELAKPENPFNKRRRILATWSRRASCSSLATATYLPPLLAPDHAVAEGDEGEEEEDDSDNDDGEPQQQLRGKNGGRREAALPPLPLPLLPPRLTVHTQMGGMARRNGTFRSPRSFSLSDLQNSGGSC